MPRYGAGITGSGINTADRAYFALINPNSPGVLAKIVEIVVGIAVAPTTAPALYLARCTARGTQTATLIGQALDPSASAANETLDSCSATQPTFTAANKIGVGALQVTAGGVWVWTFYDSPLIVPATQNNGIVIANTNASGATTGTFNCSVKWDE